MQYRRPALRVVLLLIICAVGTFPRNSALQPASAAANESILVDVGVVHSRITYPFWGINYVGFWDSIQGSTASQAALRHAGIQVLRFPGGEPANWYDWSKPYADQWSSTGTNDLWRYAQPLGSALMLQTNPTTQHGNDPSGTHAAGWVAAAAQSGAQVPFWEIGNEPDLHLRSDFDWDSMKWYTDAFNQQAAAIHAANPQANVFGPAGTNAWQWRGLHSLDIFLARTGNKQGSGQVDGVSLHYYPTQGCAGWDNVSAVAQDWPRFMEQIQSVIKTYDMRPLPVFISETNAAVGGLNCEINQTMAAALSNADLFGAYRDSGVQAIQFFGTIHAGNGWGILYGTDEGRAADTPTPSYFILPLWTRSGNEVLALSGPSDPAHTMSAYASRSSTGGVQVMLINKTNTTLPVTIGFQGFSPQNKPVHIYELRPGDGGIWDKDVIYNGVRMPDVSAATLPAPQSSTAASSTLQRILPAYSLTLVEIEANMPAAPSHWAYLPLLRR